ncbi:uncharacterized protein BDZ99DRAFT_567228 [Mytilinidion resinicola]|uniref:Phosphoglycerate mutase-like protein n=1 Tax=Mytilinidion resinicola TaxID=574789 RepID=A0A6A6Z5B4_9PEZI|nr:uncharacterized protein BDZ99DRAFT_567228 [Mytilinidion resinicola]KAF2815375.1 hypothetical protein BDZ99DRAFT_567228 [Mytilinidion resinicola]
MPKKLIHLVRHGAGEHDETHDYTIHDPLLTDHGASQASALRDLLTTHGVFPSLELATSSPLRRCIQTSLIAFQPYLTSHPSLLLLPRAQESSAEPSNTGSSVPAIRAFFHGQPVALDFSMCERYPAFNSKTGLFAPMGPALEERAKELRAWLRAREERVVAVAAHGNFLHHLTGMIDAGGKQAGGDWGNAEWRVYEFVEAEVEGNGVADEEDKIRETEWSWRRRRAEGPSLVAGGDGEGGVEGVERGW